MYDSRDRLGVSLLIALALHFLLALLLGLVDWSPEADTLRLDPVVLLPPPLPAEPEAVTPSEVEKAEKPEATEPQPEPAVPAPQKTIPERPAPRPEVAKQTSPRTPSVQAPAQPQPMASRAQTSQPPASAAPLPAPAPRISSSELPKAPPEPEVVRNQWSSGSEIVYGDEAAGSTSDLSRSDEDAEAPVAGEGNEKATSPLLSDSTVEEKLGAIADQAASSGRSGQTSAGSSGRTDSASVDEPDVTFEGGQTRKLLEWSKPEIKPEMLGGRSFIPVVVQFTLPADGRPLLPEVVSSSGSTELDNVIKQAIRNWKFSEAEDGSSVKGKVRLIIRTQ
ncbi:TonB family protein [Sediminispirochaeta bajacaliforniensis]|uniref:TonB family protein n=1 Tax=Sediminispirochaeta bajacaliforniensis TaxID=148 RepID=UPI00037E83AF|nr:TonB family protein [Sediminispirochaeta bajacaliforniensis]